MHDFNAKYVFYILRIFIIQSSDVQNILYVVQMCTARVRETSPSVPRHVRLITLIKRGKKSATDDEYVSGDSGPRDHMPHIHIFKRKLRNYK